MTRGSANAVPKGLSYRRGAAPAAWNLLKTKDGPVEKGEMATTIVDAPDRVVLRLAPSPLEVFRNVLVLGALTLQFFPSVHVVRSKICLGVAVFLAIGMVSRRTVSINPVDKVVRRRFHLFGVFSFREHELSAVKFLLVQRTKNVDPSLVMQILPDKKVKSIGLRKKAAGRLVLAQITHAQARTLVDRGLLQHADLATLQVGGAAAVALYKYVGVFSLLVLGNLGGVLQIFANNLSS